MILAWTGPALSRGQASDWRTDGLTDTYTHTNAGNDNTRRPKLASGEMTSEMQNKSLFGQLCAYLMSCNIHRRAYPRYLPNKYYSRVSKILEKYSSELSLGQIWSYGLPDRQTDRWTKSQADRRTGASSDKTPSALGSRGKNWSAIGSRVRDTQSWMHNLNISPDVGISRPLFI